MLKRCYSLRYRHSELTRICNDTIEETYTPKEKKVKKVINVKFYYRPLNMFLPRTIKLQKPHLNEQIYMLLYM